MVTGTGFTHNTIFILETNQWRISRGPNNNNHVLLMRYKHRFSDTERLTPLRRNNIGLVIMTHWFHKVVTFT